MLRKNTRLAPVLPQKFDCRRGQVNSGRGLVDQLAEARVRVVSVMVAHPTACTAQRLSFGQNIRLRHADLGARELMRTPRACQLQAEFSRLPSRRSRRSEWRPAHREAAPAGSIDPCSAAAFADCGPPPVTTGF